MSISLSVDLCKIHQLFSILTRVVKIGPYLCIVKQTKTTTTMEATIRCKRCGGEFKYPTDTAFMKRLYSKDGWCHIETENSIRCPHCMKRLNNSAEEFEEQIVAQLCWE